MTFSKVASAVLMLKLLDLAWAYAWIAGDGGFSWRIFLILTIAWLFASYALWSFLTWFGPAIGRGIGSSYETRPHD